MTTYQLPLLMSSFNVVPLICCMGGTSTPLNFVLFGPSSTASAAASVSAADVRRKGRAANVRREDNFNLMATVLGARKRANVRE